MTALPLEPHTEVEEATLARFEAAEPAPESLRERVARAVWVADGWADETWTSTRAVYEGEQTRCRRLAAAAIEAMKGGSRADDPAVAVELPWCNLPICPEGGNGEHRITAGRCIVVPDLPAPLAGQHTTEDTREKD